MKKKFLLLLLATFIMTIFSCTDSNQASSEVGSDFNLRDKKMSFTKDDYGTPYIRFEYSGDITNQTNNIYKEVKIIMELEFTLENGTVLSDVEMAAGKNTFGAARAFDLIQMFQPNQVYNIKDMQTEIFSTDYIKYPIKSVTAKFKVASLDEINDTNNEISIKSEDITNEWEKVVKGNIARDFRQAEIDSTNAALEKSEKIRNANN